MLNFLIEKLNVASKHFTAISDASHNGIVVIDRDGIVLVFNLAARHIFGETDRSFVGQHFSEIRPEAWPDLQKILKTGQPQIGKRINLPQASIVVNRTPIVIDNEVVGVVSVFQDISEYEKIITESQGFKELNAKLEAVIESSYDGLVLADHNGKMLIVNRSYERLTGLARKEMIGRKAGDLLSEKLLDQSIALKVLKQKRKVTALPKLSRSSGHQNQQIR